MNIQASRLYSNLFKSYGDKTQVTPELLEEAIRVGLDGCGSSISMMIHVINKSDLLKNHLNKMVK